MLHKGANMNGTSFQGVQIRASRDALTKLLTASFTVPVHQNVEIAVWARDGSVTIFHPDWSIHADGVKRPGLCSLSPSHVPQWKLSSG